MIEANVQRSTLNAEERKDKEGRFGSFRRDAESASRTGITRETCALANAATQLSGSQLPGWGGGLEPLRLR